MSRPAVDDAPPPDRPSPDKDTGIGGDLNQQTPETKPEAKPDPDPASQTSTTSTTSAADPWYRRAWGDLFKPETAYLAGPALAIVAVIGGIWLITRRK